MEEMHLTVAYKGTNHNVSLNPQATLADFQDILGEITNVPPSLQKLLYRGKKTFSGEADSVTVTDAGLKSGAKVTLMGSTNDELSSMRDAEKETRRREEIMRQRQAAGPSKVYSTSRAETKFKFHRIEPLPHLPKPEAARAVLEKLAADPAIKHVMTKHEFQVGVLTELAPHENPTLLGLNVNAGQSIKLRLRTDAYDGMRTYKEIRRVLCHELTHNVFGDHDDNFKTLNSQLNREVEEFETAVARGSRTLGSSISGAYEPDPSLSTSLMDSEAHSYVLGGGVGAASALVPSREEMRRRAAEAALDRQRREEQEIEDRCGSDGPAALK